MRLVLPTLFLTFALAGCGTRASAPGEPPAAAVGASDGLQVALLWSAAVDLDLYLTDPIWETLYFANNPTRSGAKMELDARCPAAPPAPPFHERAHVRDPSAGPYRIGVHFIDACGADAEEASFRLVVDFAGRRVEQVGTIRRNEFRVIAFEFELLDGGESGRQLRVGTPDAS